MTDNDTNNETNTTRVKIPKANEHIPKAKQLTEEERSKETKAILEEYKDNPAKCIEALKQSAKKDGCAEETTESDSTSFARSLDEFKIPEKGKENASELLKH